MDVVFRLSDYGDRFLSPEDRELFDNFNRRLKQHFYEKANGIVQKERFWYLPLARRSLYRYVKVDDFGRARRYKDVLVFEVCIVSRRHRCIFVTTKYILKKRSGRGDELYMPIRLDNSRFGAPLEPYTLKELTAKYGADSMIGYAPWVYRGTSYHDCEYGPVVGWPVVSCDSKQWLEIRKDIRQIKRC